MSKMEKNMGRMDRVIQIHIAVVVAGLFLGDVISGVLAYVLIAFGIIFLLTSFISFCPPYVPLGISRCKNQ